MAVVTGGHTVVPRDNALAAAGRHFKECEKRLARQAERVRQLEERGHTDLAAEARSVLTLLEEALRQAGDRLRTERRAQGLPE